MPRKKPSGGKRPSISEVIEGRLYVVSRSDLEASHLDDITVVVDMGDVSNESYSDDVLVISWPTEEHVDEKVLEGIVRLCSSAMRGVDQKILLIGSSESVDTVAACVVREYLGCSAIVAMKVLRESRPDAINKPTLAETIVRYKPS